ncbi:unnamed protein product [Staurois parvus]|uniref:Uncharacterized protein n=1 Tax=Staurois parvus TaxID=386267 RepID=A0ABN9FF18_9NEOB|nr:unnamed protein product [Staurois parvus]
MGEALEKSRSRAWEEVIRELERKISWEERSGGDICGCGWRCSWGQCCGWLCMLWLFIRWLVEANEGIGREGWRTLSGGQWRDWQRGVEDTE